MKRWEPEPLNDAVFKVWGLTPDEPRLLQVIHEPRKLAGWLVVRGDEKEAIHVSLEAWGVFTGRLVRPDGKPMTNVFILSGPGVKEEITTTGTFARGIQPDKEGKFRVEGLAPGLKYNLSVLKETGYPLEITGKQIHDLPIKPGETKDLGDIQVKPME